MAKPTPDPVQQAGERHLAEWGVGAMATPAELGPLLHREAAADVAIAHRLGAIASEESAQLLQRLDRESAGKRVRKEAKRALYRLEQRGVRLPDAPVDSAPPVAAGPQLEGFVSAVDGRGDQLVWLLKPQPGGVAQMFAVINDPEGLREVEVNLITRKVVKGLRAELERRHALRLVEVDWRYADFLMHRAFTWSRARGTRMTGDYPALRLQVTRQPAAEAMPAPGLARIGPAAREPAALERSADLLEEPELRTWFRTAEELQPFLDELTSVKDTPLVLNELQQQERVEAIIRRAIDAVFGGELRESWVRRLAEMANYFALTRRIERAAQAMAAATALDAGTAPHGIPVCDGLVRTTLAFLFEQGMREQSEQAKSSLVLTPQQAMTRRERR